MTSGAEGGVAGRNPNDLLPLVGAYRLGQAILAAARLQVPDALAEGPRTAVEVAATVGAHGPSMARLLRALAGEGVIAEPEEGRYALNAFSSQLRSDDPGGLRDFVIGWSGLSVTYHAFADLAEAIRTGTNPIEQRHGVRFHELLDRDLVSAREYEAAMEASGGGDPDEVVAAYDWAGFQTVVDVGGGQGAMLAAILRRHPDARGVLFDLPRVVAGAPARLAGQPEAARIRIEGGDMFRGVPVGGDVYLYSTVLRCLTDEECVRALRACRAAMPPASRLLALEILMPEGRAVPRHGIADLQAMVVYGGRDRRAVEWAALFEEGGLRLSRVVPAGAYAYVEAVPA